MDAQIAQLAHRDSDEIAPVGMDDMSPEVQEEYLQYLRDMDNEHNIDRWQEELEHVINAA